jgi:hypothetical protein
VPPAEADILHRGRPWGALHEKVLGRPLTPGTVFPQDTGRE